jgi:hypothetical protein
VTDAGRSVGERIDQRPIEDRILSEPVWAIERVMAGNESNSACNQPNPKRPLRLPRSDEIDRSVFGRFNSLIFDFVSLFFGFISLFDRPGNLYTGASQYQ